MKLVIGHRVIGTPEPVDMLGLGKRCSGRTCNPQPFALIAFLALAFIAIASVHSHTFPFLETHDRTALFGQGQRKSETGVCRTVCAVFCCQAEMTVESILRAEVDTPVLEIGIEYLLHLMVLRVEPVQVVVCYIEWS